LYSLILANICAANSLVGVNIKARIGLCRNCWPCDNICRIGNVKPAVFPVPVCADAKTSLPSKIGELLFCCIGDGFVYPFFLMCKASDKPND
jgi:hypothetical protein